MVFLLDSSAAPDPQEFMGVGSELGRERRDGGKVSGGNSDF